MRASPFALLFAVPLPAFAQTYQTPPPAPQTQDVVSAADDAFGRRIGVEEVGLYSESEVRGFSLQSAGNYRIEDHYFVRAASPAVLILDDAAIRVGVNGLRTDFAAPSGTVQFELVRPAPGVSAGVEAGWWAGSGPVFQTRFGAASANGRLGIAGGVQLNPWQIYGDGSTGDFYAVGIVPRWSPTPGVRIAAVANRTWFTVEPDSFFASEGRVPDRVRRNLYRGQDWMLNETNGTLAGLMADVESGGWRLGASAFLSRADDPANYFNLVTLPPGGGAAENLVVAFPRQRFRSLSGELLAARRFATGRLAHRLVARVRWRDTIARTSNGDSAPLGTIADLDRPPVFAKPVFTFDPRRGHDDVRQWSAGLGYRVSLGDRLELRADVEHVRYARSVTPEGGPTERRVSTPLLYSGALTAGVTSRLTAFASHARGLEEAGVAPGNAVNRGEVLPATPARQSEIGLRYAFPGGPSLIVGLFDLAKPLPGLRADGVFGFVGDVRHRGVELSLAGRLTPRLTAVVGATFFKARLSGDLVERNVIGSEPVGRPERIVLANFTWQVPWLEGLAVDGGVSLRGGREADAANSVRLPAFATFSAGLRQRFTISGQALTLRARVGNIFNAYAWNVTSSGLYFHNAPRSYTLTLSGAF